MHASCSCTPILVHRHSEGKLYNYRNTQKTGRNVHVHRIILSNLSDALSYIWALSKRFWLSLLRYFYLFRDRFENPFPCTWVGKKLEFEKRNSDIPNTSEVPPFR